ncbi:hypothetical protein [Streptomyces sp. NBC_01451]|uniref:hypothetical protein n=1 Tax=Streptomyces sp. NBC_01451 TaxID=2903872 RepID=UPI002E326126|nr:hypothetical protein [Streptomyces sp. NBC_01451]
MPLLAQLPPTVHDFAAHDAETRELVSLLTSPRAAGAHTVPAAVITGGPGAGRTSLLLRVAHAVRPDFPDGRHYDSIGHTDAAGRFLAGLGVPEHGIPCGSADRFAKCRSVIAQCRVSSSSTTSHEGRRSPR